MKPPNNGHQRLGEYEMPASLRPGMQPDPYDRDRLGRMGAGQRREPSITSQLARRLGGYKGPRSAAAKARQARRGTGQAADLAHMQRVVVKVHVSRHRPGKVHGSVLRHVSYVGRESASLDGRHGVFYDATQEGLNARQIVKDWEQDRHHFRLIVSPENAADLPDMKLYIRRVMSRVQEDVGDQLQWLAVDHYNTDNPHTHILLRGRKSDQTDLVMPRRYVSYGLRFQAQTVATEMLGPRSADAIRREQDRQVTAQRFTYLDRMIQRHLAAGRIDLHPDKPIGFDVDDRRRILGRLQFLNGLDLAKKGRGCQWILEPEFGSRLRDWGQRNDIIASLYKTLGQEAAQVQRLRASEVEGHSITGLVTAKGSVDEISDQRFVVVRDGQGRLYYGRVPDDPNYRRTKVGAVIQLGAAAHERHLLNQEVAAVAKDSQGIYSAVVHEAFLTKKLKAQPVERQASAAEFVRARVRSATARLAFVAGHAGSGVTKIDDSRFRIDAPAFQRFSRSGGLHTDLKIVASHSLAEQVEARALTWLDRQLLQPKETNQTAAAHWHGEFATALERRRQWLVSQGLAEFTGPDRSATAFKPGAVAHLRSAEFRQLQASFANEFKRPAIRLPRETPVTGQYLGLRESHAGPVALIATPQQVYVTRWTRQFSAIRQGSGITIRLDRSGKLALQTASQALAAPNLFNQARQREVDQELEL